MKPKKGMSFLLQQWINRIKNFLTAVREDLLVKIATNSNIKLTQKTELIELLVIRLYSFTFICRFTKVYIRCRSNYDWLIVS